MNDNPLTMEEIVERAAWKLCAQENEIWDEAPKSYRKRWRHEAAQMTVTAVNAYASQKAEIERLRAALVVIAHTYTEDSHGGTKSYPAHYYQDIARAALSETSNGKD